MNEPTEPKDIVDKLRKSLGWSKSRDHLCEAAANEIERLRLALRDVRNVAILSGDPRLTERRVLEICQPFEPLQ